jgi:hypothetical protein
MRMQRVEVIVRFTMNIPDEIGASRIFVEMPTDTIRVGYIKGLQHPVTINATDIEYETINSEEKRYDG